MFWHLILLFYLSFSCKLLVIAYDFNFGKHSRHYWLIEKKNFEWDINNNKTMKVEYLDNLEYIPSVGDLLSHRAEQHVPYHSV